MPTTQRELPCRVCGEDSRACVREGMRCDRCEEREESPWLHKAAIYSPSADGARKAVALLGSEEVRAKHLRGLAIEAIGAARHRPGVPALTVALDGSDDLHAAKAVWSLSRIPGALDGEVRAKVQALTTSPSELLAHEARKVLDTPTEPA